MSPHRDESSGDDFGGQGASFSTKQQSAEYAWSGSSASLLQQEVGPVLNGTCGGVSCPQEDSWRHETGKDVVDVSAWTQLAAPAKTAFKSLELEKLRHPDVLWPNSLAEDEAALPWGGSSWTGVATEDIIHHIDVATICGDCRTDPSCGSECERRRFLGSSGIAFFLCFSLFQ